MLGPESYQISMGPSRPRGERSPPLRVGERRVFFGGAGGFCARLIFGKIRQSGISGDLMGLRSGLLAALLTSAVISSSASVAQPTQPSQPTGPSSAPPIQIPLPVATDIEDLPVMARPRPDYDALGIPVGGFLLFPQLTAYGTYDSNVFRTTESTLDDYFFTFAPSLRLKSNWGLNSLELYGGANAYQYLTYSHQNLADWNVGADGRYDIAEGISLYANGMLSDAHESLASPNTVGNQQSPTRYYDKHADISTTVQPNRLGFNAGGIFDRYDYDNTPLIGGGRENNADRSFDDYQAYLRAFYEFSPGYTIFARTTYESRQFDQFLDRSGVHRSSTGYRVDGGADVQFTHLISGEVYLGYLKYDFSRPLTDVGGVDYGAKLDWLATPLITVHLEGERTLTPIILPGASVQDNETVSLSADYELLRNLIIQARTDYIDSSYPGTNRHDKAPDFQLGTKYLINHLMSLDLDYILTKRTSNAPGGTFNDNEITLGLTLHE